MPKIQVRFDCSDMEHAEFAFDPGTAEVVIGGAFRAAKDWADGGDDPGITVRQAEIIRDLADVGLVVVIDEDGTLSVKDI